MSIRLLGGGRDETLTATLLAPFVAETIEAASSRHPVLALLLVLEPDDDASIDRFRSALVAAGVAATSVRVAAIAEGRRFDASAVEGAHGIFVGGGLTPMYQEALAGIAEVIRSMVARGVPYAGFSAGAAVAAQRAVVGGYRRRGRAVAPEEAGEELDELDVREGLGLVPMSIDVHAAQWGTVSRLMAAVATGAAPSGIAIDEHTAIVVTDDDIAVIGAGHAWRVDQHDGAVAVRLVHA